jgi:hypothetical protein
MKAAFNRVLAEKARLQFRTSINVVMAYEDLADGRRAMQTYNGLVGELGRTCEFNYELWKFEALQIPELRDEAARQAREADMILIATHSRALPRSVKSWVESWLQAVPKSRALVALIGSEPEQLGDPASVHAYLQQAAALGQMEFFSHFEPLPPEPMASGFSRQLRERAQTSSLVLEEILSRRSRPEPRWGINE